MNFVKGRIATKDGAKQFVSEGGPVTADPGRRVSRTVRR